MAEEAATAALVAPTRATDRRHGACRGLASQPGCKVGRCARSPTGTEDGKLRDSVGASWGGVRAAGVVRGASMPGRWRASPLGAVAGWWRRRRRLHCSLAPGARAQGAAGGGGGEGRRRMGRGAGCGDEEGGAGFRGSLPGRKGRRGEGRKLPRGGRARRRRRRWHVRAPRAALLFVAGPDARHHGWYEPEGQLFSGLVLLVILHLALWFLPCCQAQDACRQARRQVRIMAGMKQKDSNTVGWFCW